MLRETLAAIRRIEDLPALASVLGYQSDYRELSGRVLGAGSAAVVGRSGEFEWYGLELKSPDQARRAARALAARGLPAAVLGLNLAAGTLTIAAGDAPPLEFSLRHPEPLALARLERCAARPGELALATGFRIAEALATAGVDQRFFAAFRRTLEEVMAALPPGIPRADRHSLALLQLTRILFLYFVESKGWLGRPRMLREEVDRCLSARRSIQRDLLHPLFFGTLNRPWPERTRLARRFGPVPFLNGGLFEPHPLERRWRTGIPTPVLRDAFDRLFERFHFTTGGSPEDAVLPDMLGRVFEGVMEPGERHLTGSYYTPAGLVDALVRETVAAWLAERAGVPEAEAVRRLDDPDPATRAILESVRLLDPAAGSGAFLLGALRCLAGPPIRNGGSDAPVRRVLRGCLYGVDRNPAAIRLAELRLWLEVIATEPDDNPRVVNPLPNLDALIRQGDSLRDPVRGIPLIRGSRLAAELASRRAAVLGATGGDKSRAVQALRRVEGGVAAEMFRAAIAALDHRIAEVMVLARGATLFGDRQGLSRRDRAHLQRLRRTRRAARKGLEEIARTGAVPWFHYPVHFADVMAAGGFDLVVGNPPWVRAEALEPGERRYLAERFTWFRAGRRGAGYGHLPDLSVAFLERALELAAPGGVVGFVVPAKLATAGYGEVARAGLARSVTLITAADLRTDPRARFDATVYPMALVFRRSPPPGSHRVRLELGHRGGGAGVPQKELGAPAWSFLPDRARGTLTRLRAEFPPLGDRVAIHLGVKTGCNRAFLDPPDTVEPELLRWAVRGRDVLPFRVNPVRRILWPCDAGGSALQRLPPGAARHLERFAGELRRRSDHRAGTDRLWTLFRTGPAAASFRVVWADLDFHLTAAPLVSPSDQTVIPLNTCYVAPVADPATALALAAWLNTSWCRALAAAQADPASGGFRRFNARIVAALPVPDRVFQDRGLQELGRAGTGAGISQSDLDDRAALLLHLTGPERRALAALAPAIAQPGRRSARAG